MPKILSREQEALLELAIQEVLSGDMAAAHAAAQYGVSANTVRSRIHRLKTRGELDAPVDGAPAIVVGLEGLSSSIEKADGSAARAALFDNFFTEAVLPKLVALKVSHPQAYADALNPLGRIFGLKRRVVDLDHKVGRMARTVVAPIDVTKAVGVAVELVAHPISAGLPADALVGIPTLIVPRGYAIDADGVYRLLVTTAGVQKDRICVAPMVISSRSRDVRSGHIGVELAWLERAPGTSPTWRKRVVARSAMTSVRQLSRLADYGAPVSGGNKAALSRWLLALEAANHEALAARETSDMLGWQADGAFILPGWSSKEGSRTEYLPSTQAGDVLAKNLGSAGTWEGWLATIGSISAHPVAMLAIYAACAGPLCRIFGVRPFVVDWCSDSRPGAVTALDIGASVWGPPGDRPGTGLIHDWSGARVVVSTTVPLLGSLPVFFVDAQSSPNKSGLLRALRAFTRGTATPTWGGGAEVTWSSVLMSGGTTSVMDAADAYDVDHQVLELFERPVNGPETVVQSVTRRTRVDLRANYGHMGRRLVQELSAHPEHLEGLKAAYASRRNAFIEAANHQRGAALAEFVAVLTIAKDLCDALGVPRCRPSPMKALLAAIHDPGSDSNVYRSVLVHLYRWCIQNRRRFIEANRDSRGSRTPKEGYVGRWMGGDDWETIVIYESFVDDFLRARRIDPLGAKRYWNSCKWLITKGPDRLVGRLSISGKRERALQFRRKAFETVLEVPKLSIDTESERIRLMFPRR
jgi:hypothetical protein